MKNSIKYFLIGLAGIILSVLIYYLARIDWRLMTADSFLETVPNSSSMVPLINPGDKITGYKIDPKINDIVSFKCTKSECLSYNDEIHSGEYIKRLVKVDDKGNWWVEGDNHSSSFDSRYFGWISPNQRSNVYVVKKGQPLIVFK